MANVLVLAGDAAEDLEVMFVKYPWRRPATTSISPLRPDDRSSSSSTTSKRASTHTSSGRAVSVPSM